jgi:polar amino acid transport system permease protein
VLGVITALMRQSANPILRYVSGFYVWLFRGTPQLVQLLIVFNIALIFPMLGIPGLFEVETNSVMTPLMAAIIALGVNEGSYMSEIVRSGMLAVDQGQTEAAKALGMRGGTLMRYIVLPQALRIIVPPTGNELIAMLKITSLAYVISVSELLNSAYVIYTRNYLIIELLFVASIWYLVLTTVLTIGQRFLERRLARGFGTTRKAPTKSSRAATKGALA